MDREGLLIDEENFFYKVRREHLGYSISVGYRVPRKSSKGYVGSRYHREEIRIPQTDLAYKRYESWIKEYEPKFARKEITAFYVNLFPIVRYYTTCPRCGNDAEILTWMIGFCSDDGESHTIICEHCPEIKRPEDALFNTVGTCRKILFKEEEEKNCVKEHRISGIKWEEWENDKANLSNS